MDRYTAFTALGAIVISCSATPEIQRERPAGNAAQATLATQTEGAAPSQTENRQEFADRLHEVHVGMNASDVKALIGRPDDVWTPMDHPGTWTAGTALVWVYGTEGHLGHPRLGSVYFDEGGQVQYVYDASGLLAGGDAESKPGAQTSRPPVEPEPPVQLIGCEQYTDPIVDALFAALAIRGIDQEAQETIGREYDALMAKTGDCDLEALVDRIYAGTATRGRAKVRAMVESLSQVAATCSEFKKDEEDSLDQDEEEPDRIVDCDSVVDVIGELSALLLRLGGGHLRCVDDVARLFPGSPGVDNEDESDSPAQAMLSLFPAYDEKFLLLADLALSKAMAAGAAPRDACLRTRLRTIRQLEGYTMGLAICIEDIGAPVPDLGAKEAPLVEGDDIGCMEDNLKAARAAQVAMGRGRKKARKAAARLRKMGLMYGLDPDTEELAESLRKVMRLCLE